MYPIDRDCKYGQPVGAQDLRSPQLTCSLWGRGSYEGNQEPRQIALQLPCRIPPSTYFEEFRMGHLQNTFLNIGYIIRFVPRLTLGGLCK